MTEASFTHGEAAPTIPVWESLFPLPASSITEVRDRLLQVSSDDLRSFLDVRREGRPDDVTTALLGAGFARWHVDHNDFSGNHALLMYGAGKLYGAQMTLDRYRNSTGKDLRADDPEAYDIAKYSVLESYRGLEAPTQWEQDYKREQRVTGGKTLAVLNAALHDHTMRQFEAMYGDAIPEGEALETFYTGLLDASIFIEAYARFRDNNDLLPVLQSSLSKKPEAPPIVGELHQAIQNQEPANIEMQLESDDDSLEQVLAYLEPNLEEVKKLRARLHETCYVLEAAPVLAQFGPNSFRFDTAVLSVSEAHVLRFRRLAQSLGYGAVAGGLTFSPDIVAQSAPTPMAIGFAALVGTGFATWGWKTLPARQKAELIWNEAGYTPDHDSPRPASLQNNS